MADIWFKDGIRPTVTLPLLTAECSCKIQSLRHNLAHQLLKYLLHIIFAKHNTGVQLGMTEK